MLDTVGQTKTGNAFGLSDREFEIIGLVSLGKRYKEIAKQLGVKQASIKTYMDRARKKVGASTSMELVVKFERGELNE